MSSPQNEPQSLRPRGCYCFSPHLRAMEAMTGCWVQLVQQTGEAPSLEDAS